MLSDPPLAHHIDAREGPEAIRSARVNLEAAQARLRAELTARGIPVLASVKTVLNAVVVHATPDRIPELRQLPGVIGVLPVRRYRLNLNAALPLLQVPEAWTALNSPNCTTNPAGCTAGQGVKIGLLDTGIDQTHPAFQDASLAVPPGFPACLNTTTAEISPGYDCSAFTNTKVIVAKSFVAYLNDSNPDDSTPDDYSPRDRVGHGTATAMCAAGETNTGTLGGGSPDITITGVAPKAWIGNYKVFGSEDTNPSTDDTAVMVALDEAQNDGMNIVSLSFGGPALNSVTDTGNACFFGPSGAGVPCDAQSYYIDNAVKAGMTVVVAAGNSGENGQITPTPGTVATPGIAPSAITVGAIENAHLFSSSLNVAGYRNIADIAGNGPVPNGSVTAPLLDVAKVGSDAYACKSIPLNSLKGDFALISRGPLGAPCTFESKVQNAQLAGAVGVIFYDDQSEPLENAVPGGLTNTTIPSVMITESDGTALKGYVDSTSGVTATIDPTIQELPNSDVGQLLVFSSRGPALGTAAIKPEVLAVGDNVFMAAQNYDPVGELYSATRYTQAAGTSFSTPMVAGAAALVLEQNPTFTPAEIKSAVVNTATLPVTDSTGSPASASARGGGTLNADAAVGTNVTISPATVSFGTAWPASNQTLTLTNSGAAQVNLNLTVQNDANATSPGNTVSVMPSSLSLAPGASSTVTVSAAGSAPAAGLYSGEIDIAGGNVPLHVPFLFGTPANVPYYLVPLVGQGFVGTANQYAPCCIVQVLDKNGLGVNNYTLNWTVTSGDAEITDDNGNPIGTSGSTTTGEYGIGFEVPMLGTASSDTITVTGSTDPNLTGLFGGGVRAVPNIVQYASTYNGSTIVAPGSWMVLFGSGLSDVSQSGSLPLPLSIDSANVTFDLLNVACPPYQYSDPTLPGRCSFPGYLSYASPTGVSVFVPWELDQGIASKVANGFTPGCNKPKTICSEVKLYVDGIFSNVIEVPMGLYSPGFFNSGGFVSASDAQTGKSINAANGAAVGESVTIFCNGLGPVDNPPASGAPAPSSPPVNTTATPTITIAGVPVSTISFSGLAPGYIGIYEVTFQIPPGVPGGKEPIAISIGGVSSPVSSIQIQ